MKIKRINYITEANLQVNMSYIYSSNDLNDHVIHG